MDSPIRQYQKQKDYRRHKLFRKIRRRQAAERQQAIDEPIRQLKRKLKRYDGGKDDWLHSQLKTYWGGELPEVIVTARDLQKPQTFAGRIAQVAGASPAGARGADLVSSAVQLTPYGIIPASLDLGMDSNSLYHRDEHAKKDVVLDLLSMIPGVSKLGLKKLPTKTLKQMWDEALQSYRGQMKFLSGAGKAGDAIDDTYGSVNVMSHFNKGKDSGIHIKPENRGKFTALKKRTGKSASWFKAHGTPAQKKMATFALNARKWKHK